VFLEDEIVIHDLVGSIVKELSEKFDLHRLFLRYIHVIVHLVNSDRPSSILAELQLGARDSKAL